MATGISELEKLQAMDAALMENEITADIEKVLNKRQPSFGTAGKTFTASKQSPSPEKATDVTTAINYVKRMSMDNRMQSMDDSYTKNRISSAPVSPSDQNAENLAPEIADR